MSSSIYAKQNPSPAVIRRPPVPNDDTGNTSQRAANRRSLSDKLRGLFRKDSSSPNRATSTDRRSTTTPVRQTSSSPGPSKSSTEAPHLRTPSVNWPFGKKKSSTSTTTKTKTKKDNRKKSQNAVPSMVISSPIYQQEIQSSIHGENFVRRSPELVHGSTGRGQSSSSYEVTPTKGYRDYVVIDQTQQSQQVITPDHDAFNHQTYTSDRSRSPSMNRQRIPNTNEYYFHQDRSTPTASIPMPDVEIISTPQRKRKVGDTPPITHTQILTEKPPISPQTSSRPPSTNPTQWKNTSSSTLNNTRTHSPSPSRDVDIPKLHTPTIPFGSVSSKTKAKRTKSQTRSDGMNNSSSTVNNMVHQNPLKPYDSGSSIYRSLPDAEIIHGSSLSSRKPSRSSVKEYPGLSAIIQHHQRLLPVYYDDRPSRITTTTPQRTRRFETSTTTLNEHERDPAWVRPPKTGSPIISTHRQDGYIRPMTPQKPSVQPDVTVIRVNADDLRGRTPSPPSRTSPPTYRSSTTVYTRERNNQFNNGEIRTWSSQQNDVNTDHRYDHQVVPPKIIENYNEYRYSPRAHEQRHYESQGEEEERYEVSFEYERHHQQYSYEINKNYDELHHATNRYIKDTDGDKNFNYSNLASTTRASNLIERDKIYDQTSRSYTSSERRQEAVIPVASVDHFELIPRTYTLRRSDSYDGLGILISADSETRLNHFIREVEPGSPGHRAGLRRNDRIISINNINVENIEFNNVLILIKEGLDNNNLQITVIHEPEHI